MTTWIISANYKHRRYSARDILFLVPHLKTHPMDAYQIAFDEVKTASQMHAWFIACLDRKINADIDAARCKWRKWGDGYQENAALDARDIRRYMTTRIRTRGTGNLRTREMRKRYPHINCQMEE